MQLLIPVLVQILSIIFKFEKLSILKLIGIIFSISGAGFSMLTIYRRDINEIYQAVITLTTADSVALDSENNLDSPLNKNSVLFGNLLLLLQCFALATSILLMKKILVVYPPTSVTAWLVTELYNFNISFNYFA